MMLKQTTHVKYQHSMSFMKHRYSLIMVGICGVLLSGCDTAQEQLGLNKRAPDEFQVIKRAPLELPPNYNLRPPAPGAPRPQEQATSVNAAETVFGARPEAAQDIQDGESLLLQQAGANNPDPSIRQVVDSESAEFIDENEPVIDKLLNLGDDTPKSSIVDAKKEAERLRQNTENAQPVTQGETPTKIR